MRVFRSELSHSYKDYSFGYALYAALEKEDSLGDMYAAGFLPDSSAPHKEPTFYMARSVRVDLKKFTPSSENRRIAKKFDGVLEVETIVRKDFSTDEKFYEFCLSYFVKRHGSEVMPHERLRYILDAGLISHISVYRTEGVLVGYVFEVSDNEITHFWYSFYELAYAKQSLGLWLMQETISRAKKEGKQYVYLGTAYGEKGLYKTNFSGLEYFDGSTWQSDTKKLHELCKNDTAREVGYGDIWKENLKRF